MNKNIRCGPETHIIPRMIARWELGRGTKRMDDSGINSNLYDEICSEFILKIIAKHDYGSQQLCNKDPFTLRYMKERHPFFVGGIFIDDHGSTNGVHVIVHIITLEDAPSKGTFKTDMVPKIKIRFDDSRSKSDC